MFEWDDAKRLWVLRERGIDFYDVVEAMGKERHIVTGKSPREGEERSVSLVPIRGKLFAVVSTLRDGITRIITVRRARDGEEREYRALFG